MITSSYVSSDVEKFANAVKPLTEGTAKFLGLLARPGAEQVGGWIGDRLQIARRQNVERVLAKTKTKLDADGTMPTTVPTKILIPILERCSVEDEEEMIDRWANLLAASASGGAVPPSYVETLASLSPTEARFLDHLSKRQTFWDSFPSHRAMDQTVLRREANLADAEYRRTALSLFKLGLVQRIPDKKSIQHESATNAPIFSTPLIGTTEFADDFLAVCSPKQAGS